MIYAALVSAYPTEADARRAPTSMPETTPYLGVWYAPTAEQPKVHVFSEDDDADDLRRAGWTTGAPA